MHIIELTGREHEGAVVALLGAAQIHVDPQDARKRAPSIAEEYVQSDLLRLWGCVDHADVVGVVSVEPRGSDAAVIRDLAVTPDYQRRGIGRALVDYLRDEAGFVRLEGDTLDGARLFYERCGFTVSETGTMPDGATRLRFSWIAT